jgi:hypothetical protein
MKIDIQINKILNGECIPSFKTVNYNTVKEKKLFEMF